MLTRPDEHDEDVAYEDIMSIKEHKEYSLQDLVDLYYPCRVCFGIYKYGAFPKTIPTCERKETCKEYKKWEALYEALNALDDREYDDMLMEDDWK